MEHDELIRNHLIDLARQAETRGAYTYSGFLGLPEQDIYTRLQPEISFIPNMLFGGSEASERQIAVFGSEKELGYPPEYPIVVMKISPTAGKFSEMLTHRDFMGAILNLGIDRSLIGDIIVRGNDAYVYCLTSIQDYLRDNLISVRHTDVSCTFAADMAHVQDIPELRPVLTPQSINVASERMDSIVAGFTNISRSHIKELFLRQRVLLNGRIITSLSVSPKPGDVITVRGFGKAVYDGVSGKSKKGRLYVTLRKYT